MLVRHCDTCKKPGAECISMPIGTSPDPSGNGRETDFFTFDICISCLKSLLKKCEDNIGKAIKSIYESGRKP